MSRALYPDLPVQHLYLALSVATGHLEVLEEQGLVTAERRDGVLHYSAVTS
jgi:DNA-binding transcriptional ArsR family regulator